MKKLTDEELKILSAKPQKEQDHSKIKWKKRTWKIPRRETTARIKNNRPPAKVYWDVVRRAGKNVNQCELCSSDYKVTIHHKDGNPFNNELDNLQVLCWHCHLLFHDPTEEGVHDELEGTKNDFDNLDDPENRKFYGIVDDDEGIPEVDDGC